MSGRPKRGPGRPRTVDSGMSPTRCLPPASPLTPDSEEGFVINESKSRTRGRPKGPIKKTRVNAQSKLKSPIRASHSSSSIESSKLDYGYDFKKEAAYANAVDAMGLPLAPENIPRDDFIPEDKLCAFCSCGPERRMYQGKLQLCAPTPGFNPFKKAAANRQKQNSTPEPYCSEPADTGKEAIDDVPQPPPMVHRRGPGRPPGRGRKKGSVVIGLPFRNNGQALTADKFMFGSTRERDVTEVFESDGSVWAHHCCASWSVDVCQLDSYDFVNVDKAVLASLTERCAHCNRYGASVVCQVPKCGKTYHYPCAASAGAFQEIQSMTMLCPDHLEDAGRLGGVEAQCYLCSEAKDFFEMLFCTSCGRHYHGRCLDPAVDPTSLVRMSWQCPDCKVCQGCRQPGDDNKMLVCDLCDKGYHTYCLEPPMTTIPKTGWKCVGCRRCEDCGSNTPGGGPTSRWHRHYTVCDSCYQQRNKGLFCQICSRAYRQLSDVAMVQCDACEKWLHAECDNVTEDAYRRITAKKMSYFCPQCKENGEDHAILNHKNSLSFDVSSINDVDPTMLGSGDEDKRTLTSAAIGRITPSPMDEDLNLIHSSIVTNMDDLPGLRPFEDSLMDSLDSDSKLPLDEEMEAVMKPELDIFDPSTGLPESPPTSDHTNEPKALPVPTYRHLGFTPPKTGGKRKLGPRLKSKTNSTPARKKAKHGRPGRPPTKLKKQASVQPSPGKENLSGVANAADNATKEEETEGLHTTVVLFSSDDKFTSEQDMCLCCGSFGKGREGQLIACSQCGQSYHPYCVGVKVNKIILSKGWRCLDCTLCEGCGKGSDEARLLLCDSCDISYHTYCLDPPLEKVPQGGWKCKWCVSCYDCGTKTPGQECEWQSNYTQCGPCASKITCPVCNIKYNENDLMIQCLHCDRWLHGSCDKLLTEEEVDKAAEYGYHCLFCRPKTKRALVCLSGPPSPRATALHHYRPQFSSENHPPQPQAKPIHPCQRLTNHGIVEMKLSHDSVRGALSSGSHGNTEVDNAFLTDSGIKQMNRLKLPAYSRKKVKVKGRVKPKKMGLAGLDKMEMLSPDGQTEPLKAFNFETNMIDQKNSEFDQKPGRSRSGFRPGVGGFVVKGRGSGARKFVGRGAKMPGRKKSQMAGFHRGPGRQHGGSFGNTNLPNFFAQQQSSLEAIMDSSSNEAWQEDSDMMQSTPLHDTYPDWMQEAFFGKNLLHVTSKKKKPKQESVASSQESDKDLKDDKSQPKKLNSNQPGHYNVPNSQAYQFSDVTGEGQLHPQGGHPGGQQQVGFSRQDQPGAPHHSVMGLEGGENWHGSNVEGLPADPLGLSEEFPNPEALYRSLDMLTDDMSSADCQNVNRDQEQAHLQSTSSQPTNPIVTAPSSQPNQNLLHPSNRNQGDLDLLSASIDTLPHVDCQEVEDIFADLELEMERREFYSGIGPGQGGLPQQVSRTNSDAPRSHQPQPAPPPPYQPQHQEVPPFQQGHHPQGMDPALTHFDANAHPAGFPSFGQDRENFPGRPGVRPQQAGLGGGPQYGFDAEHDFTKRTDLDLASDLPRERRRAPSPRTDPMKQQQKWQEDEKLGDTATISPVLYANLEHTNLQKEYPDWPNRYRAIARLWRKLSVEQREPYRLKARDNRVRLKDQGKRLLLEQSKEKRGKPNVPDVPESPASEPMTPNPVNLNVMQDPVPSNQMDQQQNILPCDASAEKDQHNMPGQPNPGPFIQAGFPQVAHSPQFQQEQPRCATPLTPMSISGTTPPMTPTSFTPTSPLFASPRMNAMPGGKGTKTSKSKKTKEDKEKDKEKRKQKLLIQQQQEREWKLLQQRRQLEQQRQQQQSQQETNLLRQEVKRTQQVKGLRALEDKKKKSPQQKMVKKPQEFVMGGRTDSHDSFTSNETPQQSPAVSIHSDDSLPLMNAPPIDTLESVHVMNNSRDRRASLPNLAMSQHGLENVRPLSPIANTQDRQLVRSLSQQPSQSSWNDWSNDASKQDQGNALWSNTLQQPQPMNEQNKTNFSHAGVVRQNARHQASDDSFMPQQSSQQLAEGAHGDPFQSDQQWKSSVPDPQDLQMTSGVPKQTSGPNNSVQMPHQEHPQADMDNMAFHQQTVVNEQQAIAHKQQDIPHQWHPEMHPNHPQTVPQDHMGMMQQNVPQQQQTPLMPQNQGQPRLQHPDLSRQQSFEFPGWQDNSSGPTPMTFQQPQMQQAPLQQQPHQQAPMQHGPPQPIQPVQPLTSMNNTSQSLTIQQQTQPGISQVPIQPGPPPPPPPPPLPPQQHGSNLPISRQPPADEQQQQQQLEMLQKQQREQLMRAQQQQFFQMQMQQQQHLLQQQQQQQQQPPLAVQPPFARPRMNQVINTKDMPEIESEEEHQERLRFLYRQRQLQKQHMQMQAQQSMFQQQWTGQTVMPGLVPNDPGNPQGMPPIRPQPTPDMMQQQLLIEYQRRMNQRHDLGQQTLQFDKVIQDLQQQQGMPGPTGNQPQPPFMEVSHQRFALRHPNPGVQTAPMGSIVPGQVPMFGVDGQQLYRMQMQQQMIMQQQPHQRLLMQKPNAPPNTAPKEGLLEKDPRSTPSKSQPLSKRSESSAKGVEEASEVTKDDKGKSNETTANKEAKNVVSELENENREVKDEPSSGTDADNQKDGDVPSARELDVTTEKSVDDSSLQPSVEFHSVDGHSDEKASQNDNIIDKPGNDDQVDEHIDNQEEKKGENENMNDGNSLELKKESSAVMKSTTNDEVAKGDNISKEQDLSVSEETSQPKATTEENAPSVSGKQATVNQQPITTRPKPQEPSGTQQIQPPPVSAPHSTSLAPSSNQQQAIHQQLVATQQRFFQMQQQRQIMMQQYQQLQQQLQQNQNDPMIGAQLMGLQQQGQFLQQNMLQAWQQMQMLQQQIQASGGFPPQQVMPQTSMQGPSPGPIQGQQWQGPMQDQQLGMMPQHPGMMNKPGMMAGQLMHPDGSPSPKQEKPTKKTRRSRAKSKDTFVPQPPLQDWMNPQPAPTKPKGKGRKGKKQAQEEQFQDPELQLQQQRLRQQILQQMEQRHRIVQQQQQQGIGRENPGMLNHPEMSGSPHDLGPPTPQSMDGVTPQPIGHPNQPPHSYAPTPACSAANNAPQVGDPHLNQQMSSPSMGIMTPEQINLSTSQLMNSALGFHGNATPPGPQVNPVRPTPFPSSSPSLNHPIGGPHSRNPRPNTQPQRFPTPERFHNFQRQQGPKKQPVVQYVADNNPFSDDFQAVQQEKPQQKIFPKQEPVDDLPSSSTKPEAKLQPPTVPDVQHISSHIPTLDVPNNIPSIQDSQTLNSKEPIIPDSGANTPCETPCESTVDVKCEKIDDSSSADNLSSEQSTELSNTENKKGVSSQALQKLESMVADMGGEEGAHLQGDALDSEMCFDLFNTNPDEEVANLCSPTNKDQQMISLCKSSSQANSVASLECHEEVPSFVSPVQDGNADKSDNKDISQGNSPAPQLSENVLEDSSNLEEVSLLPSANASVPSENTNNLNGQENDSFDVGSDMNQSQSLSSSDLRTAISTESILSSQEIHHQSIASLSLASDKSTVTSSIVSGADVTVSSVSSGVLGGHLQLPMESRPTEGDMALLGQFATQQTESTFSMSQTSQEIPSHQPDHGAMLLSGRDPMLGAANPMLSSSSSSSSSTNTAMLNPAPTQKSPSKAKTKVKRSRAEPKTRETLKEEDIIKRTLQEARRQEYERKKREYEEQQRKKRELQKELRQQKAKEKEERKRQRLLNSPSKLKSKENHVQKLRKGDNDLAVITKESLPLCEPKLILTHALMHPYGTSPFNGQCSLKGALGNAHVDNTHDYYAKFPTPSLELVLKINQQKNLVNGDIGTDGLDTKDFIKFRESDLPIKRARHAVNEIVSGAPSSGLSNMNSLSSSPDTLQYVASSSPESDPVNKPLTPKYSALDEVNRSNNDSPVFTPINPINVKTERVLSNSSCSGRTNSTTTDSKKDIEAVTSSRMGPSLGLDQDIDDLDSINVTLTLSPTSEIRVSETVASVAELIGCSPPRPSDIVIEPSWKTGGPIATAVPTASVGGHVFSRSAQGLVSSSPKEIENLPKSPYPYSQFNLASTKSEPQRKASDGPYCRHCDVLIIGIGVIRGPPDMIDSSSAEIREVKLDDASKSDTNSGSTNYKMYSINVEADERRDCFCSEPCLKQYYSLLEAGRSRTKTENPEQQRDNATAQGNITADPEQDLRGSAQAEGLPVTSMVKIRRPSWKEEQVDGELEVKRRREIKWRRWQAIDFVQKAKADLSADEISELLEKYDAVFKSQDLPDDTRQCTLCSGTGDGDPEGPSRLLNLDVDVWVHLNCALWSLEVYETLNGALMNVGSAIKRGNATECCVCKKTGATVVCNHVNIYNKIRCTSTYHFGCALHKNCMFFKDKTMLCEEHKPSDDNEHRLPSYAVFRKVFINRDEIQQIASMLRHNQESGGEKLQTLRIGSIVVKSLGQLLLHQLQTFHTRNAVYPVGFKTIRYYWSMKDVRKRCQYYCTVEDVNGMPSFTIRTEDNSCFKGISPKDAWNQILLPIQSLRKDSNSLNLWPSYITGEDLFGLTEQYVLRIIESMPGVDYMQGYNMRYGPSPIMELPLAVNPTGSARSEPHVRSRFKTRTRAIRNTSGSTVSTSRPSRANAATPQQSTDDTNSPYMKHFVYSKASQYRKLKSEWRQNVVLGRSNIQGLGLFANREIEPNSMVIEYIGSIIRNEVANRKESIYESQNRGIYMFRMDNDAVIDATMAGGPARYINHSCMPNCVAEVVTFEKEQKIIIISNRKVERGEELTYDYKFDFEDDEHKISCLCGAPNCRKWMN